MKDNFTCVITTDCPFCGKTHYIEVKAKDYLAWQDGELVQDAFPYLSADEREMLISGICPSCWDGMFSEDEDEEDYDEDWGFNEDEGFDPYEGCWTGDC